MLSILGTETYGMKHLRKYLAITTTASPVFRTLERKENNLCKAFQKVLKRIFLPINAFTLKKLCSIPDFILLLVIHVLPNTLNTQPATSCIKHDKFVKSINVVLLRTA